MGCVPPAPGYLQALQELCRKHGALLIFDEVMTGFRVAAGGAQQLYGIRPDMTVMGKVIGGGLPIAAYGGRKDIMTHVAPLGPIYQAGTLSGNPLAVSAGIAMLRYIKENPGLYAELDAKAQRLAAAAPAGITVNRVGSMFTWFFTERAGHRLRIGQASGYQPVQEVLPRHAGARNLPASFAVRSRIRVDRSRSCRHRLHGVGSS